MPLPTVRPSQTTSTASPASNSPSTSTTPTGRRLVPRSRSARSAPSSTARRPCVGFAYLSQSLKLDTRPRCGWKRVPVGSPESAAAIASRSVPARDHHGYARGGGHLRRHDLRAHPAGAERRARHADLVALELLEPADVGDQLGVRIAARVGGVETAGVGQQDQPVGPDQDRHLCREEVVVAEGDVVGRGGVVLVDHRDHVPVEQLAQGGPGVEVVRARGHVEEGQQHLRRPARRAPGGARRSGGRACPARPPRRPGAPPSRSGAWAAPSAACRARSRPT